MSLSPSACVIVNTEFFGPKSTLQSLPEEFLAVSSNVGVRSGAYELRRLRSVNLTMLAVQLGRVEPAGS